MAVWWARNLNNPKKDKKMRCVESHLFLGTGGLSCPITAHKTPSPWTSRSESSFRHSTGWWRAPGDGERPVSVLSGLWWSHRDEPQTMSVDSNGESEFILTRAWRSLATVTALIRATESWGWVRNDLDCLIWSSIMITWITEQWMITQQLKQWLLAA